MKAQDLVKGTTIETSIGVRIITSSTPANDRLRRLAFSPAEILLCGYDKEFVIVSDNQ